MVAAGLVWTTLGNPESREAAAQETRQRTYTRGSIYDRNGVLLSHSEKPNGDRIYNEDYERAFSSIIGYHSKIYGTTGLEKRFNNELVSSKSSGEDKRGHDLTITIDAGLQQAAYNAISDIAEGASVVLDAQTGEILAMASTPTYLPSQLEENWGDYSQKSGLFLPNAYKSTFAPGSDFKIISACAVIDNGVDATPVDDKGSYTFDNGQIITNYNSRSFGSIDLDGAIYNSSNVYFITKALEMGSDKLRSSLEKFKLGEDIPLDFTTLSSNLDFEDNRDEVVGSIAFGQGRTEVTPLYMAMACQGILNHGVMLKPYMVKSMKAANGTYDDDYPDTPEVLSQVTSADTAARVVKAMEIVAKDNYHFNYVGPDGWAIAAKTGTAQTGKSTNAWIVSGAVDTDHGNSPKYVVVVMAADQSHDGIYYKDSIDQIYEALVSFDSNRHTPVDTGADS